ncbi:DivIVA domain-containing protein [Cellulomonas phragmiteti]|uniref:Cell wall synthesis protein Wag31 n=1 Tax=Cellulomonas phragmiteti TaxID=478780 RepID=A0ABQ4DHC2_9CELL|nr:DivIVA domain-containing protein [Cellulomonas phragmiteti]GIG38753.1 hypothetical protein Cph01nite_05150 [Cellulomonas phragmiteti]
MLTSDDVTRQRFTAVKFREGYDQDQVDDLLDRVVATLRALETGTPTAHPLTAQDVRAVRFQATKFREGYDQDQVDDFLDRVAQTLNDGPGVTPPPPPPTGTPGIVSTGGSWWSRLLGR